MPNRILREGIIESDLVNRLSLGAEILYRRLMSRVDDYGRCEADPRLVRAACYPLQLDRVSLSDVGQWLAECAQLPVNVEQLTAECGQLHADDRQSRDPLVTIYEVAGKKYLQINNFRQRVRSEKSKCPPPVDRQLTDNSARTADNDEHMTAIRCSRARPRARAQSETESETETIANAESDARASGSSPLTTDGQPPPKISYGEFPLSAAAICQRFPTSDVIFVEKIVRAAVQAWLSAEKQKIPIPDDEAVVAAVEEALKNSPHKTAGLLLTTVPNVVKSWCKYGRHPTGGQPDYPDMEAWKTQK